MYTTFLRTLGLAILALGALVGPSGAQVGKTYRTLEARIQQADIVVRGDIADLKRTVLVPRMGKRDNTIWPDGIVEYRITVTRQETLKGAPPAKLVLVRETSDYDTRFDAWQKAHTSFLWFVGHSEGAVTAAWETLRLGPPVPNESSYVSDAPPLFAMDFSVLRDPTTILSRARAFAARKQNGEQVQQFMISHGIAERCSPSGDANSVVVPVNPALEAVARTLIAHPERSLSKEEEAARNPALLEELRLLGIGALRHFPSASNAKLLKTEAQKAPTETERTQATEILQNWHL